MADLKKTIESYLKLESRSVVSKYKGQEFITNGASVIFFKAPLLADYGISEVNTSTDFTNIFKKFEIDNYKNVSDEYMPLAKLKILDKSGIVTIVYGDYGFDIKQLKLLYSFFKDKDSISIGVGTNNQLRINTRHALIYLLRMNMSVETVAKAKELMKQALEQKEQ